MTCSIWLQMEGKQLVKGEKTKRDKRLGHLYSRAKCHINLRRPSEYYSI